MGAKSGCVATMVWDNGGLTFDRYTVRFEGEGGEVWYLAVGDTGNVPNGFCMHVDGVVEGEHLGEEIAVDDMTAAAARAVRCEERAVWS